MDKEQQCLFNKNLLSEGKPQGKYEYCIDSCQYEGKELDKAGDMIHCYMCYKWFHEKCVNHDPILMKASLFACPSCRCIPAMMYAIFKGTHTVSKKMR